MFTGDNGFVGRVGQVMNPGKPWKDLSDFVPPLLSANLGSGGSEVKWPKVCIMVLNWNGKRDTLECLASIQRLDYPKDKLGVIAIDNGSTDGSQDAIRSKLREMESEGFSYTYLVEMERNEGAPKAYNAAFSHVGVEYEYVLKLDNDVILFDPQVLKSLVLVAEGNCAIGIIGPKIVYANDPTSCAHAAGFINWTWCTPYQGEAESGGECDFVTGCAMLIKKSVIEACGVFLDEDFFVYWDDTDLCIRAQRRGFSVVYLPSVAAMHKVSQTTNMKRRSPFAVYYVTRNRVLFGCKHLQGNASLKWRVKVLFLVMPRAVLSAIWKWRWKEVGTVVRAHIDGLRGRTGKVL